MQDLHTQQIKTSAPIHLSLQELESVQRLDEALMIAEFALSCMASVPADKPGIGAAWGRTRHLRHTSCRSRARRGRSIMRHCSEPSHNVRKTQL